MKKKDMIYVAVTLILMSIVGVMLLGRNSSGATANQVEVVQPIDSSFNSDALSRLHDPNGSNLTVPVNLKGVGNSHPFGS